MQKLRAWLHPFCILIRLYWGLKKTRWYKPRLCLFKVSCSNAVFGACVEHGTWQAIRWFLRRVVTCTAEYSVVHEDGQAIGLKLASGRLALRDELSESSLTILDRATEVNTLDPKLTDQPDTTSGRCPS